MLCCVLSVVIEEGVCGPSLRICGLRIAAVREVIYGVGMYACGLPKEIGDRSLRCAVYVCITEMDGLDAEYTDTDKSWC